ncbi:MAG: hypothetical protein A2270_01795 [Elusimicrobia bacterium RIFOXYA12_FULL_51_18]|nr:MAG: hypothetical protein A2270_01795 [Elusimicrobia bacterium RIFOXYA12_FULL_51_18]OGS28355.1 MAG: hypothetical protein A2218_00195 [Elusimicrobia bacterium RIFOXYA2_FULL_53_38]
MRVSRRKVINLTGYLAAAWWFCAILTPLSAQILDPINTGVTVNTLSFSWTADGGSYIVALSTKSDFSVFTATGPLATETTSYNSLAQNEIYYFRVKRSIDPDTNYYPDNQISTVTGAAAPSGSYFVSSGFVAQSSSTAQIGIGWAVNGNPEWTDYLLEYYKDGGPAWASTFTEPYPPVILGALEANTTYYFRVKAVNLYGSQSAPTVTVSTTTLARTLSEITATIYETSSTISWPPLNSPVQAQRVEGYKLRLSSSENLDVAPTDWSTADNNRSSTTLSGLDPNTTYYYTVGTINLTGVMNSDNVIRNFTTLAVQPHNLQLISASTQTATLGWTALPAGPSSATALGYQLEASSNDFGGGTVLTTTTYDITNNTLTLQDLDPNTTYYFRVGTLNRASISNYSTRFSTITLSVPLSPGLPAISATQSSVTVTLTPPLPSNPQKSSCEGYLLQVSSGTFGAGSAVYSSFSYTSLTNSLTLDNLRPNTTYYLRMATLNWTRTPNFIDLPPIRTSMPGALESASITNIWESSAAVSFGSLATDGYVLEASLVGYFNPIIFSSTTNPGATGLIVSGLDRNTAYYFRAGALYNGATVYTLLTTDARSTLAKPLGSPLIAGVFHTSATVSWTALAAAPQNMTAEAYHLEASTSPDFNTVVYTAATSNPLAANLTAQNLIPNTSYYFRAGTLNWDNVENYVYTPATATLANAPFQTAFTELATGQMTVNWLPNLNPSDTLYRIRFSSNSGFSEPPVFSSDTRNYFASFYGLDPNTTYYSEVTAINRRNVPEGPYTFNAMATLAYIPDFASFSGLGVSSITLNWARGQNPLTDDTNYQAEISSNPAFLPPIMSSMTLGISATFYGLVSDATYYMRVFALNRTGLSTTPEDLGQALTLPATAYILPLAETFSGNMTDGFTLHWAANGNSEHTVYNLEVSTAGDFNTGASSKTASTQGLSYTFSNLLVDTTYWARIQSRGQTDTLTNFVTAGSTKTELSGQASALLSRDTTVTLQASYGLISVFIPFGSLGGSSRIVISPVKPEDTLMPPDSAVSVLRPTGIGLIINQFPPVLVLNPITITLPYRISDLQSGIDRSRLVLALYDESNRVWVPLPSVSDLPNHKVTAQTWHLSTFQLMETLPAAELGGVKIYPNPYRPSSISDVMHFSNMPPYAKVKIFTFLGELVKTFTADANGMAYWEGKNTGEQKVASGVYIALLQTQDKKYHKAVKVVIER